MPSGQMPTQNLQSQYEALKSVLGGHNAMLALVDPQVGKTLLAQEMASQLGIASNANSSRRDRPIVSDAPPDPVRRG